MKNITGRVMSGLVLAAGLSMGCSSEAPNESVGSLDLQLQSEGSSGSLFGLRGTFVLNDPENLHATSNELNSAGITLSPQVGSYQLELCTESSTNPACPTPPTYGLYRLECQGGRVPWDTCWAQGTPLTPTLVEGATLTTPNPQPVTILANQSLTARFAFTVPGDGNIVFARGSLNVAVDVTEGFPDGQTCSTASDCASEVCTGTPPVCQVASCNDGVRNGSETGPDCGGACAACGPQPTCSDGAQNGDEEGVDCGGSACAACFVQPTCSDGVQNGDEEGVDCGGSVCAPCFVQPTCSDGQQNGDEEGVDCGGSVCAPCF